MPYIKIYTYTYSCPTCKIKLFRTQNNDVSIGCPYTKCPRCQKYYPNPYQQEWYNFKGKWFFLCGPLICFIVGFLLGAVFMKSPLLGVLGGALLAIILAIYFLTRIPSILQSKRRMRSKSHLQLLRAIGYIEADDYDRFMAKADLD